MTMTRVGAVSLVAFFLAGCAAKQRPEVQRPSVLRHAISWRRTVVGTVFNERTGRCMRDVILFVEGTRKGMLSDANGRYTIADLPAGNLKLKAQFLGYVDEERSLPEPEILGDWVIGEVRNPRPLMRTDTVNFYMRVIPRIPALQDAGHVVECKP